MAAGRSSTKRDFCEVQESVGARAAYARGPRLFLGRGLGCLGARHRWRSAYRIEAVFVLHILYGIVPGYTNRGFEEYVLL